MAELNKEMRRSRQSQGRMMEERQAWMTQGATGPSSEDYLLGKEMKTSKAAVREEVNKFQQAAGGLFVQTKKTSTVLEAEARLREDPMMMFQRAEVEERKKIVTNPVKMKKIQDKVALMKELKKAAKKARKEAKKSKKSKGSSSDSESEKDVKRSSRERNRSRSPPRRSRSPPRRSRSRSRSRERRPEARQVKPMFPSSLAAKYGLIHPNGAKAAAGLVRKGASPSPERPPQAGVRNHACTLCPFSFFSSSSLSSLPFSPPSSSPLLISSITHTHNTHIHTLSCHSSPRRPSREDRGRFGEKGARAGLDEGEGHQAHHHDRGGEEATPAGDASRRQRA